jgi:hypothetical protein
VPQQQSDNPQTDVLMHRNANSLINSGGNMNRDWLPGIAANISKVTVLACCLTLVCETVVAQPGNDFAPAANLETITPSQNDSTYTPDPYYTPEITLATPATAAPNPNNSWTPPGTPVYVQPPSNAATSKKQNNVRSLMATETWEPPRTPVAPGYDPSKLTHTPIPWLQQPGPQSAKPPAATPGFALTEAAQAQLQKSKPGNSIIRPNTISPVATNVNKMVSNSFAGSASKASGNTLQPAPSQTLAPKLTIPRPIAKPVIADIKPAAKSVAKATPKVTAPNRTKPKNKSDFAQKPSKLGSQTKKLKPENVLPAGNKLSFDSAEPFVPKKKKASALNGSASTSQYADGSSNRVPSGSETFERTQLLALVGGEPIFVGDTLLEVNQLIERHMGGAPESQKVKARRDLVKKLLPKMVNEKMLYVGALQDLPEEANIEDIVKSAAKEFDEKALPDLLKKVKVKDAGDYDRLLRSMGSSLRKRRDTWAREQLTRYFISEKLNLNKEITHQQLLDEYRANIDAYKIAEKSKWEQIMVRFDRFADRDEAYQQIVEIGNRIVNGASLSAVAKKESHGFRASEGGQHNWTGRDALVLKELDEAIFALPIGKLSDVIETRDGLHIVRVIDRQEAGIKPFSEAQVDIKKRLKEKMQNDAFEAHLVELKKRIPVEYFPFETNDVASRQSGSLLE